MKDYTLLEEKLNITFKNKALLKEALTHSSYGNEHHVPFNERLEFLGDAVLELCMSKYLMKVLLKDEGYLTKRRSQAVREEALNMYASHIDLKEYILLGQGEEQTGGRDKPAIIADAFEALLGAIFQEFGFDKTYQIFEKIILPYIDEVLVINDYKTKLQEYVQADKRSLKYQIVEESGPAHNKSFKACVLMDDNIIMGYGIGKSKKEAEQNAAYEALKKIAK